MGQSMKETVQNFAVSQALKYLDNNPQEAFPKILAWADQFDKDDLYLPARQQFHKILEDQDNNWMRLINSLWTDIDPEVRKVFFRNFIVNASLQGSRKINESRKKYGCNIPWAILMDPTSACNLHCTGCWAAEYGNKLNLTYEELDDIINQATALGTHMFLYTGGEPMVRKADLIRLCEAHPNCVFSAFTNGTLIDETFADEMLRVKNFYPAISIEGFEEATDFRRGKGTYQATMRAMKILKEKKLPFGVSGCYTSKNIDSISSEEFFDHLVECGAKFAWFFHYMPVGNDAAVELLPSPDQREKMYNRIKEYRNTKPIFTIDFQNDAKYVNGCIAGGRNYLHINANGDIELVHLSIIRIPIFVRKHCWKHISLLCLWLIVKIIRLMKICSNLALCLKIQNVCEQWLKNPVHILLSTSLRKVLIICVIKPLRMQKTGSQKQMNFGLLAKDVKVVNSNGCL